MFETLTKIYAFQPFLRFYCGGTETRECLKQLVEVSTLLEILHELVSWVSQLQKQGSVSTLLEILPLMCSVLVGF